MKYTISIIGVFLFGAFCMYLLTALSDKDYFTVRILDNDKCSNPHYSILMKGYRIQVSKDQIETQYPTVARGSEAFIYIMPPYNGKRKHQYRVIAEYTDCEKIQSSEREAERGRVIYEWIEGGKVTQQVRS